MAEQAVRRGRFEESGAEVLALRRQRDFLATIIETAGFLVMVFDARGRLVRFNRRCEELCGRGAPTVLGLPFWDVFAGEVERARAREAFRQLRAGRFPLAYEVTLDDRGQATTVRWSHTALFDERGQLDAIVAVGIETAPAPVRVRA